MFLLFFMPDAGKSEEVTEMSRLDQGKISHVEFLRSIRFAQGNNRTTLSECPKEHFASFVPHAREGRISTIEDSHLVRSAN